MFARRPFLPGSLVSYFNGVRARVSEVVPAELTTEQRFEAGSYYIMLGLTAPASWGLHKEGQLVFPDIVISLQTAFS